MSFDEWCKDRGYDDRFDVNSVTCENLWKEVAELKEKLLRKEVKEIENRRHRRNETSAFLEMQMQLKKAREIIRTSLDLVGVINSGRDSYDYRVLAEKYLEDNK